MAIFCLLFIVIGGVSASDVVDMSNNPDNNNLVSDSTDLLSEESIGNYYADQLSNEDVSSLDGLSLDSSGSDLTEDDSKIKSGGALSSPSALTDGNSSGKIAAKEKTATSLSISNKTVYSGTRLILTLKDKNGKVLKDKKVVYNITGFSKLYTKTSDSKGQVKLVVSPVGSHKSVFTFAGDDNYAPCKLEATIDILKSDTCIEVKNTTVPKTTGLYITLKNNKSGNVLADKKVFFKIPAWNNKVYTRTTDSNGQAKLPINTVKKFDMTISFDGSSYLNKTSCKATIIPVDCGTKLTYSTKVAFGRSFIVTLKKIPDSNVVSGKKVSVKVGNKTYTKTTNNLGRVYIPVSSLGSFDAQIKFAGDEFFTGSSQKAWFTVIKGDTLIDVPDEGSKGYKYIITLKNSAGKGLSNSKLVIKINNKVYNRTTDSKGQVSFKLSLQKGSYPIQVNYAGDKFYNSSKVSKTFKVVGPSVTISKIVSAAQELKTRVEYINLLNKSYSVTIDNRKFTLDEFAYLMAGAITNIQNGSGANVKIKNLSNDYQSSGAKISGKLSKSEYLKLADNVTKYVDSKNRLSNYHYTNLGKMEADLYIYAFTAILDSYGKNNNLPSSVTVKTNNVRGGYSASLSQNAKILNCREIFDADTFAKYLKTGGKSALNDAIKKKAKEVTSGLTNPLAKAVAIFRFVRDDITYSFYSNSLKGASGTLSSRSGNCCDKANLIVAMCRSVGVYARYSHAQGCTFQSGLYTGHVWAQVYDPASQTWYSADATSFRNEVGNIKNWNTKSYYRDKNYVLIPF